MEPMPSVALKLFGSFSSTPLNSSMAAVPRWTFSSDGAPGMYWLAYAVARHKRALSSDGSKSLACLKSSTAASYWPVLKLATPLLSRSRALSLFHPEPAATTTASIPSEKPRRAIAPDQECAIESSILVRRQPKELPARIHLRPARRVLRFVIY